MKICTRCRIEKPSKDFPRAKQNRDGLSSWCRQCTNDDRKQKYHSDPEHREKMKAKTRTIYHADEQYRESVKERSRKTSKEKTETGARKNDEHRARQRVWSKNRNPDNVRRWKREWHRKQYETNPEWREQQRQRSERRRKQEYATTDGITRWRKYKVRSEHRRRAIIADAGTYTNAEWDQLCTAYDHCCLCCGKRRPLTVDHIVPLSKGGANTIDNLQPLCLYCNDSKGTRTIDYRPSYTGDSYEGPVKEVAPPSS